MILHFVLLFPLALADQLFYFQNDISERENPLCVSAISCQMVSFASMPFRAKW
jgi:hypothetical protein